MVRIGVTGLMASGKSTVSRRFEARGAVRLDGDVLGWETLRVPAIRERIIQAFGPGFLDASGEIDRARLGSVVFREPRAMARLNEIVQPALLARVRARLDATKEMPGIVVLDAALIGMWGLAPELDGVVLVSAPERLRIARLMAARGLEEGAARERIEGQKLSPLEGARRLWRIKNDGDPEELLRRADAVWDEIARGTAEGREP